MQALESQIRQAIRDAGQRTSRKPLQWGGLAGYQQLAAIDQVLQDVPLTPETAYLTGLAGQVRRVVEQHRERAADLQTAHEWLQQIAACLQTAAGAEPPSGASQERPSQQVRAAMEALLATFPTDRVCQPAQAALERSWRRLWQTWGPDLLHCYDVAGLPAANLQLEGVFGELRRHARRISGCRSTAPLRELGHFQILLRAGSLEEVLEQVQGVDPAAYQAQRQRVAAGEAGRQLRRRLHHDPGKVLQHLVDQHAARRAALAAQDTPVRNTS